MTRPAAHISGSLRWLARATIGVGAFMCVFEIVRNWGNWQPWPGWVVDYFCAALLIQHANEDSEAPRRKAGDCRGLWCGYGCSMRRLARGTS